MVLDPLLSDTSDWSFVVTNVAVASGIAADAVLATLGRFRQFDRTRDAVLWAAAIGLTHWLLPMIGFIGGWYAATWSVLEPFVYGTGAMVMAWFLASVVRHASSPFRPHAEVAIGRSGRGWIVFWAPVWAVSADALVTGPGKTAAIAHWSETQVWLSFPFVGAIVFALVLLASAAAMSLRRRFVQGKVANPKGLAMFFLGGTWLEIAVFTGFGLVALRETLRSLGLSVAWSGVIWGDLVVCALFGWRYGAAIRLRQREEAQAAFGSNGETSHGIPGEIPR